MLTVSGIDHDHVLSSSWPRTGIWEVQSGLSDLTLEPKGGNCSVHGYLGLRT
jgi:hypothetical protein